MPYKSKFRVLLVEDNFDDAEFVRGALGDGFFDVAWVRRKADALERLNAEKFDAVLLDIGLPDSTDTDIIGEVCVFDSPVVVLSGLVDDNNAVDLIAHGAHDVLAKGRITTTALVRVLQYSIIRFINDKTDRIKQKLDQAEECLQCLRTTR